MERLRLSLSLYVTFTLLIGAGYSSKNKSNFKDHMSNGCFCKVGTMVMLELINWGIWDYRNPMFTGIYRNPILITEIQLYYQVYHDLCKFRHI